MGSSAESERNLELELLCKNIKSSEKSKRQIALKELLQIVSKQTNDADLKRLLDQTYLHLVKCYTDRFESTRSLAILIVNELLSRFDGRNEFFLDYILPTIRRRIGLPEIVEESEEVQLQLLEQVGRIVDKFQSKDEDFLMRVYNDVMDIVIRNLSNQYANAHRQCCKVIQLLAIATPSFYIRAENLVDPLIALLCHRQSATRTTAVETLGIVGLYINNKNDKLVQSIVSISPLLTDSVAAVRRMCGIVGCKWLMQLRDRYSFFERIVPLVLCCLKDDLADIREEINLLFIHCGDQYFEENEKELQRIELIDHEYPCSNYIETVAKKRPTLGCRALVQKSLRMINIIVKEIQDWKEPVRLHSLKLLWEVVLFAEKAFTCKFMELFPVLAKACQDDENSVVKEAKRVAFLMGQLLNYSDWMEHAMRDLKKFPSCLGILRCFNSLFAGAELEQKQNSIEEIAKLISTSEMCHNLNEVHQSVLLDLIEQMVKILLDKVEMNERSDIASSSNLLADEERYLFEILVKTIALSNAHENEEITNRGLQLYEQFCRTPENRVVLQGKYTKAIIIGIEDLDCEHSERSERIVMLFGCIKLCGFQKEYFDSTQSAVKMVLDNSTANAQIKILSGVSMAFLDYNHENMEEEALDLLTRFIKDILEPALVWKAGRNAESIRAMAIQALCSIGYSCTTEARGIFPSLAKHFISLVEDELAITRAYAIRCILKSGPFPYEDYRQLTIDILSRLDDPCANVRSLAIECLPLLEVDRTDDLFSETSYSTLAEAVISRLFLYLDDPFIKIRPILLDSLSMMAKKHPVVFENETNKLPSNYLYNDVINELKKLRLE
ncbi:dynein axonemal assembly factor 5 [Sitodiplosis mosellana]|uniref:dynein axonemal assembly factor 5 n=1 Tax=Sitodiplosis mosellana TaxID=263140 RepID=UPI00244397BA|nr:dynein axonemal assembly factor 5 [Sitodiplosis mosellana]